MSARGMSLLEVMVALALLSLAMLGAVAVIAQARAVPTLTHREAAALRTASEWAARIALNPAGFRQGLYDAPLQPDGPGASASGASATGAAPLPASTDACASQPCGASQRAAADRAEMAASLARSLPGASLRMERGTAAARVIVEWPITQHAWMAAASGNGCARALQCLRLEFAP